MDTDFRPTTKADPTAWKKKLVGGAICLAFGVTPLLGVSLYYGTRNITPVDMAAPPHPTTLHAGRFRVNYPGLYEINYRAQRTLPYDKLICLMGIQTFEPEKCEQAQPRFATSWILRDSVGGVYEGQSDNWSWTGSTADFVDVGIGSFRSNGGVTYTLDVTFKGDTSALSMAHPRLVVEIHPSATEGWVIPMVLTLLLAIVLVPVGLWKIAAGLIARNWRSSES